jgi:perosamine synthetase
VAAAVLEHGRYGIVAICGSQHNAERLTSALAGQGIEADTKRFAYRPMYTAPCFRHADGLCPIAEQLTQVAVACRLEDFARFLPPPD